MRRLSLSIVFTLLAITFAFVATGTARAGGGCGQPSTDVRGTEVELKELCILPTVIRAGAGETITWVNRDATPHTVTGAGIRSGDGNGWGSLDNIEQGHTFSHVFDGEGVYPYFCWLHPGMVGAVVVGDGNAAAFPASAGGDLPAAPAPQTRVASQASGSVSPWAVAAIAVGCAVAGAVVSAAGHRLLRRRRIGA